MALPTDPSDRPAAAAAASRVGGAGGDCSADGRVVAVAVPAGATRGGRLSRGGIKRNNGGGGREQSEECEGQARCVCEHIYQRRRGETQIRHFPRLEVSAVSHTIFLFRNYHLQKMRQFTLLALLLLALSGLALAQDEPAEGGDNAEGEEGDGEEGKEEECEEAWDYVEFMKASVK